MSHINRREFAISAAAACQIAATVAPGAFATASEKRDSDLVRLGFIGLGNRGDQVLDAFLKHTDCTVAALCDIYEPYIEFAAKKTGGQPFRSHDYRAVLERSDVDAVVICTPDHWHALMTVDACAAGKDVYVEKPLSLCVAEGRAIVAAEQKYGRIVQVGIHRASSDFCNEAAELIRNGAIGKVTVARAFHIQNEWPLGIGRPENGDPPEGFDWNAWLGPAPLQPYNLNRSFYRFRWFYDFSGGQVTNMGVHYLDVIQQALGESAPRSVTALGGKIVDFDNREIPDTLEVIWQYPSGTLVTFSQFNTSSPPATHRNCEVEFRGTTGTLYLFGNGYEIVPEVVTPNEFAARTPLDRQRERGWRTGARPMIKPQAGSGHQETSAHARNFLDSVRSRKPPACPAERGHRSTSATLIANIALRTGRLLTWDATAEKFESAPEADAMLRCTYRPPYLFPTV